MTLRRRKLICGHLTTHRDSNLIVRKIMRGPEDFIGQQFFDANFKSLPGQRLRNTAVAHFVHFRSLLWVRASNLEVQFGFEMSFLFRNSKFCVFRLRLLLYC